MLLHLKNLKVADIQKLISLFSNNPSGHQTLIIYFPLVLTMSFQSDQIRGIVRRHPIGRRNLMRRKIEKRSNSCVLYQMWNKSEILELIFEIASLVFLHSPQHYVRQQLQHLASAFHHSRQVFGETLYFAE